MTEFNFPTRYDEKLADEGVWFLVDDEHGNIWGEFKCALLDRTTPRWAIALQRFARKNKGAARSKNFEAELFVEMSLLDWKLKDAKGKEIPYSKETAIRYFTSEQAKFVLIALGEKVENVLNFTPEVDEDEDAAPAEAPAKN